MPELAGLPWQWIGAGALGVFLLYLLIKLVFWRGDPDYLVKVRQAAADGDFETAGKLQLEHGAVAEALNLFVRGKCWSKASVAAQRLGQLYDAGQYAREAREWERAAELYQRAGETALAAECFQEIGRLVEAAKLLEGTGRPKEVAGAWEAAFEHRRAEIEPTYDEEGLPELAELAKRAAKAMDTTGDAVRARYYRRLSEVDELRAELGWGGVPAEASTRVDGPAPATAPAKTEVMAGGPQTEVRGGAPVPDPGSGDQRYELVEKLGEGGMGEVYRALDRRLDRTVAMKFLPSWMTSNDMMRQMFAQEAKLAASLNHPNIITVHDYGVKDGRPFLCMELVDGHPLTDELDKHPKGMPLLSVINVARGLFEALAYAHEKGIIHRDIKPANVMLTSEGRIKLADFGIARMGDSDKTTKIVGTPAYMAPEQFRGKGVDARTDTFAAGVTLYELVTGRQPFEGADRSRAAIPPKSIRPEIPASLDTLVQRCVALDPVYRYNADKEILEQLSTIRSKLEASLRDLAAGYVQSQDEPAAAKEKPTAWDMMRRKHDMNNLRVGRSDD